VSEIGIARANKFKAPDIARGSMLEADPPIPKPRPPGIEPLGTLPFGAPVPWTLFPNPRSRWAPANAAIFSADGSDPDEPCAESVSSCDSKLAD